MDSGSRRLDFEQTEQKTNGDRMRPIPSVKFPKYPPHAVLHGILADIQSVAYEGVATPVGYEYKNPMLIGG